MPNNISLKKIVSLAGREIFFLAGETQWPTVYYIKDKDAGGLLINSPPYTEALTRIFEKETSVDYIFYPSFYGASDVDQWRACLKAETLAYTPEIANINGTIDIALDRKSKLTRTIDFLPMAGRTQGSCALRMKNLPGAIFFGPILTPNTSGWPTLVENENDFSFESRLFGALALKDLKYDYAFTDQFIEGKTHVGPGASNAINDNIDRVLDFDSN